MALAAATVINAVAALLVPVALSGGRVYTSRLWPLTEPDLPAWLVTAESEEVEDELHNLSIEAAGHVRATADVDDSMHALAAQGLTALFANPPYALRLVGIDREVANTGEASMGVIRLRMTAQFLSFPSTPESIQ